MMVNLQSDSRSHTTRMTKTTTLNPFLQNSALFGNNSFGVEEKVPYPRADPWIRDSLSLLEDGRDDSNAWTKKASALRRSVSTPMFVLFPLIERYVLVITILNDKV